MAQRIAKHRLNMFALFCFSFFVLPIFVSINKFTSLFFVAILGKNIRLSLLFFSDPSTNSINQ